METIWPTAAAKAISLANGSLIFDSGVEEIHDGRYKCTVDNQIGSGLSKIVQLHVQGKIKIMCFGLFILLCCKPSICNCLLCTNCFVHKLTRFCCFLCYNKSNLIKASLFPPVVNFK